MSTDPFSLDAPPEDMSPPVLRVAVIEARVADIAAMAPDWEAQHVAEDALWWDVLTAIASGSSRAQQLAAAALKTSKLNFHRRYA